MKPKIKDELLDELLENYRKPEDLIGPDGLFTELKKRLINRILESELTTHLGYDKHERPPEEKPNTRNGHSKKTLRSDDGKLPIQVPRDRKGDFEPLLVPKHQRHFDGFDYCIVSLYARGLGVREIQEHLKERGLRDAELQRHGGRLRGGWCLEESLPRPSLSDRLVRCRRRQNPPRRQGHQPGCLYCVSR